MTESVEQHPPVHDSCEESDEEWNYMKAKEGQTEKENNVLCEEFKENIEPEPVTEKEISSVELKEQVDVCGAAGDIAAPKTPEREPVPFVVDDVSVSFLVYFNWIPIGEEDFSFLFLKCAFFMKVLWVCDIFFQGVAYLYFWNIRELSRPFFLEILFFFHSVSCSTENFIIFVATGN